MMTTVMEDTLQLDEESIDPEMLSMPVLTREIGLQQRPNWLLVKMMNALEQKRQGKGLGWSRVWNKYGMNTFRTHICKPMEDASYVAPAEDFLAQRMDQIDEPYRSFVKDLVSDPDRMVFTFYHNAEYDGVQYEGITFSMGRKRRDDRTKRDRIDIVLEDRRVNGAVDGKIDRVRIYVCPWETYQEKVYQLIEPEPDNPSWDTAQPFYDHLVKYYHGWKGEDDRQWSHWSVRFIDYFAPRSFIPKESSFT